MDKRSFQILIVFLIIEGLTLVAFLTKKQFSHIYELLILIALFISIYIFEYLYKFRTPNYIKTLAAITIISHNVLEELFAFYKGDVFDKVLHLFGTFSLTILFYFIFKSVFHLKLEPRLFVFFFITILGIAFGCLFEILEFSLDILLGQNNQHSLIDTNLDMIANTMGAFIAGYWVFKFK